MWHVFVSFSRRVVCLCSAESVFCRSSKPRVRRRQFAADLRRWQPMWRVVINPQLHSKRRRSAEHRFQPSPCRHRHIRNECAERLPV